VSNLAKLTIHKEYRARAYQRLRGHGVLMVSDVGSLTLRILRATAFALVTHLACVWAAAILLAARGEISAFEAIARGGAALALALLLLARTWELASSKVVLLDSQSVQDALHDDVAFEQFALGLKASKPVREQALVAWINYVDLVGKEFAARKAAYKKNKSKAPGDEAWARPLDESTLPKLNFATVLDDIDAHPPDALLMELSVLLEASPPMKMSKLQTSITDPAPGITIGISCWIIPTLSSDWQKAFEHVVDQHDIDFHRKMSTVDRWASKLSGLLVFVSFGWYLIQGVSQ
jgi:hypothetical protein